MRVEPMPGIPPEVACPHCGGYVRGHQWIAAGECSILSVWDKDGSLVPMLPGSHVWVSYDDLTGYGRNGPVPAE